MPGNGGIGSKSRAVRARGDGVEPRRAVLVERRDGPVPDLSALKADRSPLPGVLGHEAPVWSRRWGTAADLEPGDHVVISFALRHVPDAAAASVYCASWPGLNLFGGARADGTATLHQNGHELPGPSSPVVARGLPLAPAAGVIKVSRDACSSSLRPPRAAATTGAQSVSTSCARAGQMLWRSSVRAGWAQRPARGRTHRRDGGRRRQSGAARARHAARRGGGDQRPRAGRRRGADGVQRRPRHRSHARGDRRAGRARAGDRSARAAWRLRHRRRAGAGRRGVDEHPHRDRQGLERRRHQPGRPGAARGHPRPGRSCTARVGSRSTS